MPPPPAHSRSQRGATLVEVLVALGIGVMVIALIVLAHHTLTSETSRLSRKHKLAEQQEETFSALRADLHGLFLPVGDPDCGIELENSATNLVTLGFCRWLPSGDRRVLPASNHLERITYRFSDESPPALLIVRHALNGPEALTGDTTNRILNAWPRLLVQLHDGNEWKTNWIPAQPDNPNPPRPRAARIVLLDQGPPGQAGAAVAETMVVIPSGLSATSTLLRAGSSTRN